MSVRGRLWWWTASLLAAMALLLGGLGGKALEVGMGRKPLEPGTPVPALLLPAVGEGSVELGSLSGSQWVVAFVSPTCGYCRAFQEELLQRELPGVGERLVIVARPPESDRYTAAETEDTYRRLAERHTVLIDSAWSAFEDYHVSVLPLAYLVDQEGRVAEHAAGHPFALRLVGDLTPTHAADGGGPAERR